MYCTPHHSRIEFVGSIALAIIGLMVYGQVPSTWFDGRMVKFKSSLLTFQFHPLQFIWHTAHAHLIIPLADPGVLR